MNLFRFYKFFIRIARFWLSNPARSTGPAHLRMNSPLQRIKAKKETVHDLPVTTMI